MTLRCRNKTLGCVQIKGSECSSDYQRNTPNHILHNTKYIANTFLCSLGKIATLTSSELKLLWLWVRRQIKVLVRWQRRCHSSLSSVPWHMNFSSVFGAAWADVMLWCFDSLKDARLSMFLSLTGRELEAKLMRGNPDLIMQPHAKCWVQWCNGRPTGSKVVVKTWFNIKIMNEP